MVSHVGKGRCDSLRGRRYLILELDMTPYPTAILLKVSLAVPESQEPL